MRCQFMSCQDYTEVFPGYPVLLPMLYISNRAPVARCKITRADSMDQHSCSKCGAPATHKTPLTGTNEVPTNDYRCTKHKGSNGYSPIPGVRKLRRLRSGSRRR